MLDFNLYLAQSPLRSDAQNLIIEKATELGADGVYPIFTDNCTLSKSVIEKKIPKWQRIMYEASKQCERAYVPKCFDLTDLKTVISMGYKVIAFCERCTNKTLYEYCLKTPIKKDDKILVIIGPEGGFSEREFEFFRENNVEMLTLGDLILKAETAVIIALGNIIYEYNR
jgi:16S rRNA (uracil1498-N3)-methyltransferase